MSHPAIPLGVPEMDADHAVLELMFERVPSTADADLVALYLEIEAEVIAHFDREEALMERAGAPVIHCHKTQHRLLLDQFVAMRPGETSVDPADLRRTLRILEEYVEGHVGSVDRVTSQFLGGTLDPAMVAALRLPEGG
ncbi:MAG: hemerythrin family protein [Hyphomicrobiales bacterium]|nr:hemerythrin family protein [Hyphomicrobiales bacterium]